MRQRAWLFNTLRDNRGLMMIDKETEEFSNVSTSLGTLDQLQAQAQAHMAAPTHMSLEIFTGITPSGLNASTEGAFRIWYSYVHSHHQEHLYGPHLSTVLNVVQLNEFGTIDPEITFEFEPLWEESSKESRANESSVIGPLRHIRSSITSAGRLPEARGRSGQATSHTKLLEFKPWTPNRTTCVPSFRFRVVPQSPVDALRSFASNPFSASLSVPTLKPTIRLLPPRPGEIR